MQSMWEEPKPEEQEAIIKRVAETIYKYDMDLVAILMLESIKPLATVGSQLARFVVAPFIPFVGEKSMPYLATFERKENVEKLIRVLEERGKKDEAEERGEKGRRKEQSNKAQKKGWRRLLPI